MSRDVVSMNPVSQSHSLLQAHWHLALALTVLMEHGPPLALIPLSRSPLSSWRWLSPGFAWWDDSPVTNWSQSIYLVTEFQLDCDRGDTGERRAEVRCKDERWDRKRDRACIYRLRMNITPFRLLSKDKSSKTSFVIMLSLLKCFWTARFCCFRSNPIIMLSK